MRTYSTSQFEIRIQQGLLEMRIEGVRTPDMGTEPLRAFDSLLASEPIRAAAFDIRASDIRFNRTDLECRVREIGRKCRGLPIAFIGRADQQDMLRLGVEVIGQMGGCAHGFRSRDQAHAWLRANCEPA